MPNKWTINNAGGGNTGADLIGCHIKQTATGYDFTKPNNDVLKSTTSTTLPFSFPAFDYKTYRWTITVDTLSTTASGSWSNNAPGIKEEEGSWSAGATIDAEADEAAAAAP
jgi:hypothetical protein